jgi:hypothetical protein
VIHAVRKGQTAWTWRGLEFDVLKSGTFACAKVLAGTYPVTMTIRGDDAVVYTKSVTSSAPFRLPVLPRRRLLEFDLVATGDVYELVIAKSMEGLKR